MNIWHDISADRIKKDDFIAVVEIEKGGTNFLHFNNFIIILFFLSFVYCNTLSSKLWIYTKNIC